MVRLIKGNYKRDAEEFKCLIKQIKDINDNELHSDVIILTVENKAAQKIKKRNPKKREELLECVKTENEEYNQELKQKIIEDFPEDLTILVADNVL